MSLEQFDPAQSAAIVALARTRPWAPARRARFDRTVAVLITVVSLAVIGAAFGVLL